jgi:hypothetical protein
MATISGALLLAPGPLSTVDSAVQVALGTKAFDGSGNQYVYLQGVASTVVGSVVTYDEAGLTTLTVANAVGPIAVAMGITVANKYGWYLIDGSGSAYASTDVTDNGNVYLTATPGQVEDTLVAGDRVKGALFRASRTGAGLVAIQLFSPFVDDIAD